jgi:hypothetical protein
VFLTPPEIVALTQRRRRRAQVEALRHLGIEHRVRPDGSPVVLRAHVEAVLGGVAPAMLKDPEPDWSALGPAQAQR